MGCCASDMGSGGSTRRQELSNTGSHPGSGSHPSGGSQPVGIWQPGGVGSAARQGQSSSGRWQRVTRPTHCRPEPCASSNSVYAPQTSRRSSSFYFKVDSVQSDPKIHCTWQYNDASVHCGIAGIKRHKLSRPCSNETVHFAQNLEMMQATSQKVKVSRLGVLSVINTRICHWVNFK